MTGGHALGFVFADYLTTIKDLRVLVDEVIKDSRPSTAAHIEYRFVDKNEWPVTTAQEEKLTAMDLIVNQNVCIQFKSQSHHPKTLALPSPVNHEFKPTQLAITSSELKTYTSDATSYAKTPLSERPSDGPYPYPSTKTDLISTSNDQNEAGLQSFWRRRSGNKNKDNNAITSTTITSIQPASSIRPQQSTRKRFGGDKLIRLKSSKSKAKPIMLSYARQEAAQHALDLKEMLNEQGFQVYLVS